MLLNLPLSIEAEATLRKRAASDGKPVERFVQDVVEAKLREPAGPSAASDRQNWFARFNRWVEGRPLRGYVADDSRESIYAERDQ